MPTQKSNCGTCDYKITKSQGFIFCENCKNWFHYACANVDDIEAKVIKKLNSKWICEACKNRTEREIRKSLTIPEGTINSKLPQNADVRQSENQNNDRVMEAIAKLTEEIRDLKTSMTFYAQQYEDQKVINESFAEEIKKLKKINEETRGELLKLKNLHAIKDEQSRANNVVILGINSTLEEQKNNQGEIKNRAQSVIRYIDPHIRQTDYNVHVLSKSKENSPLLISFQTAEQKMSLIKKRKEIGRITSDQCGLQGTNNIFINDDLTKEQRELFRSARRLNREGAYKFVWVRFGSVLAKKK